MTLFKDLKLSTPLLNALADMEYDTATPIQAEAFSVVASGRDVVGIAQTGTGKTFAYLLPILRNLKYSTQINPRVLIMVPTRELVVQVVEECDKLASYTNLRVLGVYGGTNINTQKKAVVEGTDIIVATPGRLYDLAVSRVLQLKSIHQVVIDEVDVMLDLGFRYQLRNIFDLLPPRRQHIMFSATMTEDVSQLIDAYFVKPTTISIAVTGTPLENIEQFKVPVPNYYTKENFLQEVLKDSERFYKVIVFVAYKKIADRLFESLDENFPNQCAVIHSNKSQNYRLNSIADLKSGNKRIMIATDISARGLDIEDVSHVINFDVPTYPENYMHRIGRTGRAEQKGETLLLYTDDERESVKEIEKLMKIKINEVAFPEDVVISKELTEEERPEVREHNNPLSPSLEENSGPAFHEKKEKNTKVNQGGSYRREIKKKYKKPKTRGDKNYNRRKKR